MCVQLGSTQKTSVLIAQCGHTHSNHVRNLALKCVRVSITAFNLLTTTQVSLGEKIAAVIYENKI